MDFEGIHNQGIYDQGTHNQGIIPRIPPQAVEVERRVLGAMLLDGESVSLALEQITPDDFYLDRHRYISEAVFALYKNNRPVDIVTVAEQLEKNGKFNEAGGDDYLAELSAEIVSSVNLEQHCRIVKEKALLRTLIQSASQIVEKAYDPVNEPAAILDLAAADIYAISQRTVSKSLVPIKTVLAETFRLIESYGKGEVVGVPTGFRDFDGMTNGLQKTDLVILAARPAMGKTALALSILANAAIDYGKAVAFFSLEMGREQLAQRILCRQAQVNMQALRSGHLPQREYAKLSVAVGPISDSKIFIDDHPSLNILELRAKCRNLQQRSGLDLIMIDYLQLMSGVGRVENRQQEISSISRGLKALAKELKVPVLALSQLSRAVESRDGGRPQLSDLRESGAIEQDADLVAFIYREEVYNENAEKGKSELILAKQRNGPIGTANLTFVHDYASFTNYTARAPENDGF